MSADETTDGEIISPVKTAVKKPEFLSDDEGSSEDQVLWERKIVVCNSIPNTEMFCVSYPPSKRDAWDGKRLPAARYKKNVRLLEMRFMTDTTNGSYDKKKAESMYADGSSPQKGNGAGIPPRSNEEQYEGRAFVHDHPIANAIGFLKNDEFFVHPLAGSFEMRKSIRALNKKRKGGKSGNSDDDSTGDEEDRESNQKPTSSAVRVKFSRPETERQKKRREASALHREKKIANDLWIPMNVYLNEDDHVTAKVQQISGKEFEREIPMIEPSMSIRDLVNKAIICGVKEELVIESGKEHMLSKQRIDELSGPELQLKAHMVKSHVMKASEMRRLIDPNLMSTEAMLKELEKCSRLVNGVWVLDSNLMFKNLPSVHKNTHDLFRAELWRNARDLALCLIDGGHRVTRSTLITCFKLNEKDADEILSTFGTRCEVSRSWKLRIERDEDFLNDPLMRKYVISEKEKWIQKFYELDKMFQTSLKSPKKN
ncbi:unnamed protein product [Caenorhabditis brenneri]